MNNQNDTPHLNSINAISRRTAIGLGAAAAASMLCHFEVFAQAPKRRVVVWSENTAPLDKVYPQDVNTAIADGFKKSLTGWEIITAGLDQPNQGITEELLNSTDVLVWWGHKRHDEVKDALVDRIVKRVKDEGMGFISVHSSHFAKPYKKLMSELKKMDRICSWREYKADGTSVKITVKEPNHPIAKGVKDFDLPKIERYGEPFVVPTPEAVPFEGVYTKPDGSQEPGRMGMCWTVGKGRVFYLTPGHETYDDFYRPEIRLILSNAVEWAAPKK
jgi:trehalose utilization protein